MHRRKYDIHVVVNVLTCNLTHIIYNDEIHLSVRINSDISINLTTKKKMNNSQNNTIQAERKREMYQFDAECSKIMGRN